MSNTPMTDSDIWVTDTPRTDSLIWDRNKYEGPLESYSEFCRELERELNAEKQHVTELEGRLRVLWDKLENERKCHLEHLRLQEEHLSEIERENERLKEQNKRQNEMIDSLREMYAKEAKP